jgi:hypothetical protein
LSLIVAALVAVVLALTGIGPAAIAPVPAPAAVVTP